MASIFDLKTDTAELESSNGGTSRMEYNQQAPTRDVTGANFWNGPINFRWQTSGQRWWVPSRTYIRTRLSITTGGDVQPAIANQIAPNMGLMSNFFQSAQFEINQKVISRTDNYIAQIDALETRMLKSRSWLETVGKSLNFWEGNVQDRVADISSDGKGVVDKSTTPLFNNNRLGLGFDAATNTIALTANTGTITFAQNGGGALPADVRAVFPPGSYFQAATYCGGVPLKVLNGGTATTIIVQIVGVQADVGAAATAFFKYVDNTSTYSVPPIGANIIELCWCPPLSIFKYDRAIPSGDFQLTVTPQIQSAGLKRAIESNLNLNSPADYKINVVDMYLEVACAEGPRADDITYLLDLEQTMCQTQKVQTASLSQLNFDVSPSTYALTMAYQDSRAGTDTRISSSKFKAYDVGIANGVETALNRFYVNYAGQNLPAPDADPLFVAGTNYLVQRYNESLIYSGGIFDTGGSETLNEWLQRGLYMYFAWPKDATDRSTRVQVYSSFQNATDVATTNLLIFSHTRQVARVKCVAGRVVDVQLEDV